MKKFRIVIIVLLFSFMFPCFVSAETIADYRAKIKAIEAEKAESQSKSADVQKRIDDATNRINEITREIAQARKDQESTQKDIKKLNNKISDKEEEIKDLVAFYQISDNDNFYLKFIFGADSFEDFIYRFSVAEQLTEANDKLVGEMNDLVAENKKKVEELKNQEKKLNNLNAEVTKEVEKLGDKKRSLDDETLDADDEIKALNEQIAFFKKEGCSENQDVTTCSLNAPSASGFVRPTPYGYITSYYGGRIHPIFGTASYHSGVDIAANTGTDVYATTSGKVIYSYASSGSEYGGFGRAVLIAHNVNGKTYTSLYGHLSSASVSIGEVVQRGQVIGAVGSTGWSTGPHLHFQMMYGSGYGTTLDPMSLVDLPLSW